MSKEARAELYISVAHWLWGFSEDEMLYGPPSRGMKDKFAMWLYDRGRLALMPEAAKTDTLAARFARLSEHLRAVKTLPIVGDLYYAVKNDGEGTGWRYVASGVIASDIHDAARALSTHTAAGAGPVGEAVGDFVIVPREPTEAMKRAGWPMADFNPLQGDMVTNIYRAMIAARPVDEPGEVERLTRERDHWKANHDEMVARNAVLRDRPDLPDDRLPALARIEARAEAALAETRERLEKLEAAAGPIAAYTRLPGFERLPADHVITQGSRLAARQLTAGDLRRLDAALTGDSQEAAK